MLGVQELGGQDVAASVAALRSGAESAVVHDGRGDEAAAAAERAVRARRRSLLSALATINGVFWLADGLSSCQGMLQLGFDPKYLNPEFGGSLQAVICPPDGRECMH